MKFHNESVETTLQQLSSDSVNGLSSSKAEELLKKHGENRLREKKKKSTLSRFIDQFKDVMILILLVAAAISFAIACMPASKVSPSGI